MKFHLLSFAQLVFFSVLLSCSHSPSHKVTLADLSPEEVEQMNREALALASARLKQMVMEAKNNPLATNYLATDLFLKGNMSLMEGDYLTASVLFEHLATLVPQDDFVQKKYAVSLIRVGDLERSLKVLENLFQKSHDEKVALILGGVYSGLDQETKARTVYQSILKVNPKNEDACVFLSKSHALAKDNKKAFSQLSSCSKADSKNGMFDYYAGKIHLDAGNLAAAKSAFKKAHDKQPSLSQAVNALGVILEEEENYQEAAAVYEKHLKKQPLDTQILARIVHVLFLKEKFEQVIPYAEKLSDLEPENLNLKVKLGILYTDSKKYPEAISVFKDLLAVAPQSDKILYYLGAIHQEMNELQPSIEYFNQIPSTSGLYTDSSIQMANMLSVLAQQEHIESKDSFVWKGAFLKHVNQKLKEMKDLVVEFSVIKAGFYEGIGSYDHAMEAMKLVAGEKNFSTQHKYYLANLYEREKRFQDSTDLIMTIIEEEPKNAHAWNFLGYSLLERGDELDKAFEYIQKAHKMNPEDGYIRDSLGWYYYKKGNVKKALEELHYAHKKVPDDVEILKHLAIIHRNLKDYSKAKSFLESALKHARYEIDKREIATQIESLSSERLPASRDID